MNNSQKFPQTTTIKGIAKLSGVSVATVSRAINKKEGVSQETKERVLKLVHDLKYHSNLWARGLVMKKGDVFEIVIPQTSEFAFSNPYYAEILKGIAKKARESNKYLLFSFAAENYIGRYRHGLSAGIIVLSNRIDDPKVEEARRMKVPMVLIPGYPGRNPIPTVDCDNVGGAFKVIEHLIGLGHERIAFLNGPKNSKYSIERFAGYLKALEKNHIPFREELVLESNFKQEDGFEGMKRFLSLEPIPTAVFVVTDYCTLGALKAIREMNYNVPQDISLVGFGDMPFASMINPPLTTVHHPFQRMGYEAAAMVIRSSEGKRLDRRHLVLPVELAIRESTAPPRRKM